MTRILVVEDEESFSDPLSYLLRKEGYEVSVAETGPAALEDFDRVGADLVLLDLMLPGLSGVDVCRALRHRSSVPVIMLTAKDSEIDKVVGLEIGADDYIPKPFNPRELVARVRAVMRRSHGPEVAVPEGPKAYTFDGWKIDMARRQLSDPNGELKTLTSGEFNILALFCQHARQVLSRDHMLDLLHGRAAAVFDRSIDVQISRLRRKIEPNLKDPTYIKTVRYGGYFFTPRVTEIEEN